MAEQNLWPYSDFVPDLMLANSMSTSCGTPMVMLYCHSCIIGLQERHVDADFLVEIEGVIDHLEELFQHVIHQWTVAPSMATCITSNSVKSSTLLWSLPSAVHRMASAMLLLTSFVMAFTAPSFAPMTD